MRIAARFLLLCSLFLLVLIFTPKISAQTDQDRDLSKPNQNWQCLSTKKVSGHTVELSSDTPNQFPPAGSKVYIVECVSTKQGAKCTTGECDADTDLVGNCNDLTFLQTNYQYQRVKFDGRQPAISNFEGKVGPFSWESQTLPETGHTFFGVGVTQPIILGEGNWPTLQLGTFYFPNSSESCTESMMRWDPYGRIFDSGSLEPIPGVSVTLFSKINNAFSPVNLPGLTNPQQTQSHGVFNFVVPDGTYSLSPQISTHTFPNSPDKLNPNYNRAYFDIYRGGEIVQQGFIQHRDIPMDPNGAPVILPAKILDYNILLDKLNSKLIISGSVSHPLSKIRVFSGDQFLKQITSTKFGVFTITLDNARIDHSLPIRLDVIKTDLNNPQASLQNMLAKFFSPVFAQNEESSVSILPIMNNIDGYAFDSEGNTVPNATVTIFLQNSTQPFYSLKADSIGYFSIPSQFLPPLPYFIQVKSPIGKITNLQSTEFALFNAKYAQAASVNYGNYNPQPPGTYSEANNLLASAEESADRTVIGPDGKTVTVDSETGEIIQSSEESQIVTVEEETFSEPEQEIISQEKPRILAKKSNSLAAVLIITFLSLGIAVWLYLKIKNKTS